MNTTVDRVLGLNGQLGIKAPVKVATTANITLSGEQTIDGIAVVADDRVLVKNQTAGADNGIYKVSTGTWTRTMDWNDDRDFVSGTRIYVRKGTSNGGSIFVLSTDDPITLDTTALVFDPELQFSQTVASRATIAATSYDGSISALYAFGYASPGDGGAAGWVAVGAEPSHEGKVQSLDGQWWEIDVDFPYPEHFGAQNDGSTDDTTALQNWAAYGKAEKRRLYGREKDGYVQTDTVWMGVDSTGEGIHGLHGNGAKIIPKFSDKPVWDLFGIENGRRVEIRGWRFQNIDSAYVPTCVLTAGRPKQAVSVVSSGNMHITENQMLGYYSIAGIYTVESESNTIDHNLIFNYRDSGHSLAMHSHDYYAGLSPIYFDARTTAGSPASTDWSPGETVTFSGGNTGTLIRPPVYFGTDEMFAWVKLDTPGSPPANNETMTGDTSAETATVNHPTTAVKVLPAASINVSLGVEEGAGNALHHIHHNFFNLVNGRSDASGYGDAVVLLEGCADAMFEHNNLNCEIDNAEGILLHLLHDQTVDPANAGGVNGFIERGNFYHSRHRYSIVLGDSATGTGTYVECSFGPNRSAGNTTDVQARFKYIGATAVSSAQNFIIYDDLGIDLTSPVAGVGMKITGTNVFYLRDETNSYLKASAELEGKVISTLNAYGRSTITIANGLNRLKWDLTDSGMEINPPVYQLTASSGAITVDRKIHDVAVESGTLDTITAINYQSSAEPHGFEFFLKLANTAHTLVFESNNDVIMADDDDVTLVGEDILSFVYDGDSGVTRQVATSKRPSSGWGYYLDGSTGNQTFNTTAAKLQIDGLGGATDESYLPHAIRGTASLWDTTNDDLTPISLGDSYNIRLDLPITARTGSPGELTLEMDISSASTPTTVIVERDLSVDSTVPYSVSVAFPVFVGSTFLANGAQFFLTTDTGTVTVNSPAIMIQRVSAGTD